MGLYWIVHVHWMKFFFYVKHNCCYIYRPQKSISSVVSPVIFSTVFSRILFYCCALLIILKWLVLLIISWIIFVCHFLYSLRPFAEPSSTTNSWYIDFCSHLPARTEDRSQMQNDGNKAINYGAPEIICFTNVPSAKWDHISLNAN